MIERIPYPDLYRHLGIEPGITAIIGSGGKSTLMRVISDQLLKDTLPAGGIVLTTSTHIRKTTDLACYTGTDPDELAQCLDRHRRVVCGIPVEGGKLAAPAIGFDTLAQRATYVIVEADGSRGLPLKAHAPHEPVVPPNTKTALLVMGAQAFGRPVGAVVHRTELFCPLAGCQTDDLATPERVARVVAHEIACGALGLPAGCTLKLVLTHAGDDAACAAAEELAVRLARPVFAVDHPTATLLRAC